MVNRSPIEDAPVDRLLSVLATEPRRRVLRYLRESSDDVTSLETLAEHVAAREDGSTDPEDAAVRLHHADLPKLADAGLVDYDPRTNVVRYREHPAVEEHPRLVADGGWRA